MTCLYRVQVTQWAPGMCFQSSHSSLLQADTATCNLLMKLACTTGYMRRSRRRARAVPSLVYASWLCTRAFLKQGNKKFTLRYRVQATQRAGRAGRTRPGKCFRLYTQAFFERQMAPATPPEILRTSLLSAVLHLKSLPLQVDVLAFDFLDRPSVGFCINFPP